jgi:hypothetical protein
MIPDVDFRVPVSRDVLEKAVDRAGLGPRVTSLVDEVLAQAKLNATAWSLKPGWVSVEAGQVLKLRVVERGRLTLQMEFLHSYENAGVVSFHCTGGCGCPQQRPHPTRWSKLMSGGGAIRLKVDSSNASECVLHIRHHAEEPRVKFTALSVQVE